MKDLRNHINQAANNHTELVDNDAIWAGIESKMKESEKKRRFPLFFIWGLSTLLVVFSGLGIYNLSEISISNIESKDVNSKIATEKNAYASAISNSETEEIKSVTTSLPIDKKPNSRLTPITQDIEITTHPKSDKSTLKILSSSPIPNNKSISQSNIINNPLATEVLPIAIATQKQANYNPGSIITDAVAMDKSIVLTSIAPITNSLNYKRSNITLPAFTIPSPMPIQSDERSNFSLLKSINIYSQYARGKKTIVGSDATSTLRNDSESLLEQFRFGIESDIIRITDFTLYGGVSYAIINDQVSSAESFYEDKEITYVKTIRILPDGTEEEIIGTDELPHLTTRNSIRYNSHKFISMPVGMRVGKRFSNLHLGLGFGVDLNYYLSDTHTILGEDGRLMDVQVGGKWSSPSLHTAITADYRLTENWFLHTQLMYRNTSIKNTVQEKYSLYGLNLGVKFEF